MVPALGRFRAVQRIMKEIQGREVIDQSKLNTDLSYRFQYVSKFMGFEKDDIQVIHESAKFLAPLVPGIVNSVYSKLFSFDVTTKPFTLRNSDFSGEVIPTLEDITHETPQIKHRKDMLSKYLVKLVTAEYDEDFLHYLNYVGRIHTIDGKKKNVDGTFMSVDYIHCNALLGYVSDLVISAIMEADLTQEARGRTIRAFNKLLWIQNDLFARHYIKQVSE
jgi:hypothetical protein